MIDRPILENDMEFFRDTEYHLIHGTNDDNVHFLFAARMTKELTKRGIEFDNFVKAIFFAIIKDNLVLRGRRPFNSIDIDHTAAYLQKYYQENRSLLGLCMEW